MAELTIKELAAKVELLVQDIKSYENLTSVLVDLNYQQRNKIAILFRIITERLNVPMADVHALVDKMKSELEAQVKERVDGRSGNSNNG